MIRALVADDERLARQRLADMLAKLGGVEVIGESEDGPSTVEAIHRLNPNLVFLDVQMPGLSGLEVLARVESRPHAIFTTAFAEHAVAAFELNALDYLLKPIELERLAQSLDRAHRVVASPEVPPVLERAAAALREGTLERLFVRRQNVILPIVVGSILRLEARGDYVAIYTDGGRHLMRITLGQLEQRLDPTAFLRLHRSHIVNLNHVRAFRRIDSGRLQAELADGTTLIASRQVSKTLRKLSS